MGRSVTNVVGNGIASEVVAKGEEEPMTESEALVHAAHFDAELERRNGDAGYGGEVRGVGLSGRFALAVGGRWSPGAGCRVPGAASSAAR